MSTTTAPDPRVCGAAAPRPDPGARRVWRLGGYAELDTGRRREILSLPRPDGSTLVVDRAVGTLGDGRLVAHLAPEEPAENARIVCEMYLADGTRGRCRRLTPRDLDGSGLADPPAESDGAASRLAPLRDADGHLYRIREVHTDGSVPELRWTRSLDPGREEPFEAVSLRDVVARLQDYEPARAITTDTIAARRHDPCLSSCRLAGELQRLVCSPIVLNRGLREAVQRKLVRDGMSMSEIAIRCGRVKRDCKGNESGETSWLARRIGQLPEGGEAEPTPWVHSDVLALIAREGLGASPREVEL
jgi:hypothetical protein